MKVLQQDSLEFLKQLKDYQTDIVFADPPYALGSEVIIRQDGKVDYAKANDFMNKWEMPTGDYWEKWFIEAYRTLKHGGYLIMYGMDRQLLLFKYYASLAGFQEQQSIYWYYISNFPKATDLSKMIDKNAGAEREQGEPKAKNARPNALKENSLYKAGTVGKDFNLTSPSTDLAKKYDGYKYSVSPLKQTCETIMVFHKPNKKGNSFDIFAKRDENGLPINGKQKNNHPTLKPIDLNNKILKLFKTPNDQVIVYPFAGSGSEIIGGLKANFQNWYACEINQEYVDIANARIKHYKENEYIQLSLF